MNVTLALTPSQRNDARAALALLAPVGITLEQAARIALGKRAPKPNVTVAKVADEFLRSRLNEGCRPATFDWYEERLNVIVAHFGEHIIDSISKGEFKKWLEQSSSGMSARAATARAARALWRYAQQHDPSYVNSIITEGLTFQAPSATADGSKKFLEVETCAKILNGVPQSYRSAVALMLFAGIRPEEIAGERKEWLKWEHVNVREKLIRVPAEISKTGQARLIEGLPETIWAWLTPEDRDATVSPHNIRTVIGAAKLASGLGKWKQDGLRHSFATYAMGLNNNPGQVAVWLGHNGNPTMLYRHYRGLTTKAEADKFFALRP
jgi:integrase